MSILWLQPLVWIGLALLAVPVLVHLLTRQTSRRVPFPSLRFLRASPLSALTRRTLADWPLLIVRVLVLALAVAALAAPVMVSDAKREVWNRRIIRAVVVTPATESAGAADLDRLVAAETRDVFASRVLRTAAISDDLRDAAHWLSSQPAGSREVVVIGDLRAGDLTAGAFDVLPSYVGIRLLPLASAAAAPVIDVDAVSAGPDGVAVARRAQVTLEDGGTSVEYGAVRREAAVPIRVLAAPAHEARARAVLDAVLAEGLIASPDTERRLVIAFDGADAEAQGPLVTPATEAWMRQVLEALPMLDGGEQDGALVVRAGVTAVDARAPHVAAKVASMVFDRELTFVEPRRIPAATLAGWSRPPADAGDAVTPVDEGDRRWFWGAALVLLVVEQRLRRRGAPGRRHPANAVDEEARVA